MHVISTRQSADAGLPLGKKDEPYAAYETGDARAETVCV